MTTAREYLVSKGLAKAGRGKFSNDAKAALATALASGQKFSDWPKSVGQNAPAKAEKASKPASETTGLPDYVFPSEMPWPESEYSAVAKVGKKVYSMREVCNNCRVSLVQCACGLPMIHGSIAVTITRKKGL